MIRPTTLGLFLAFFLSAFGFVFAVRHVNTVMTQEVMTLSDDDFRRQYRLEQQSYSEVLSVRKLTQKLLGRSTEWKNYSNPYLGFSFQYPDMAVLTSDECAAAYAPVQPVTDNDNSRVFVALGHRFGENCETHSVTLRELQLGYSLPSADTPWVIDVFPAAGEEEITTYIRKRFGPGCTLSAPVETAHAGTVDFTIERDGLPPEESQCSVNYAVAVKHSPDLAKAAVWILGHDATFMKDLSGAGAFDEQMAESFTWEE